MIIPLVGEDDWSSFLEQVPDRHPYSGAPLLTVAPTPKDEILGVGGLNQSLIAGLLHSHGSAIRGFMPAIMCSQAYTSQHASYPNCLFTNQL
jgi:hypothetical protein